MEYTTTEVALIQEAADKANDAPIHELNELQLAFVGGGIADISTH
jgi:hypothetical protein